jgi:hypothetical protein
MLCYTATATLNVVLYERTICRVQIKKEVIFVLKRGNQFLYKDVWESTRLTSTLERDGGERKRERPENRFLKTVFSNYL